MIQLFPIQSPEPSGFPSQPLAASQGSGLSQVPTDGRVAQAFSDCASDTRRIAKPGVQIGKPSCAVVSCGRPSALNAKVRYHRLVPSKHFKLHQTTADSSTAICASLLCALYCLECSCLRGDRRSQMFLSRTKWLQKRFSPKVEHLELCTSS